MAGWIDQVLASAKAAHPDQAAALDAWAQTQGSDLVTGGTGQSGTGGAQLAVQPQFATRDATAMPAPAPTGGVTGGGIAGGTPFEGGGTLGAMGGGAPAPQQQAPAPSQQPSGAYGGKTGAALANDPKYIDDQINKGFQQKYGRAPNEQELNQWRGYANTPDTYSDGTVHQGWNPYLYERLATPGSEGSADPRLAGTDTIVGQGQAGGGGMSGGGYGGAGGTGSLLQGYSGGVQSAAYGGSVQPRGFNAPADYRAPTADEVINSPAAQARLKMGQQALERSSAAKGTALTGGTLKDLAEFSQGLASTEYGAEDARQFRNNSDTYGRRFGENQNAFNQDLSAQSFNRGTVYGNQDQDLSAQSFNRGTLWGNQDNTYGRLSGFAGLGLQGAQTLGQFGNQYASGTQGNANATSNVQTGQGQTIGDLLSGAGNYQAGQTDAMGNSNSGATIGQANNANATGTSLANNLAEIDWGALLKKKQNPQAAPTAISQGDVFKSPAYA